MFNRYKIHTTIAVCLIGTSLLSAQPVLKIDMGHAGPKVSPVFYGLMTEEINYSYDGGLYGELVRNRAFLDNPSKPDHWSLFALRDSKGTISLDSHQPFNESIPASLRLDATAASPGAPVGVSNEGYWGIPLMRGATYHASFYARASGSVGPLTVSIVSDEGKTVYAKQRIPQLTNDWGHYEVDLKVGRWITPTAKTRLVLAVGHPGTVWFGFVSLFPPTWHDQPNGFRKDLLQMLVDLNPKFLRFPGGNYLEGDTIETRFDWKKTIGPVEQRAGHPSPWGYRSTDGMGLSEFLQWCDDMGAEPVLAVYAGYSLKGAHVNPGPDLQPFVQDALDEIEYVTGGADTRWGAQRAKDGHPGPYPLHYVEIGNEDWFDKSGSYDARFAQFYDAIKARWPKMECISTVGNEQPENKRVHSRTPDLLDEHYYRSVSEFLQEAPKRFDAYERKGPNIFVGEWAAYETPFVPWDRRSQKEAPTPNMRAAIGDAAWMAGMERNADIIKMNCYAPLLVNVNGRQWRPNLIGYDALHAYGSPSYYAIKMFSQNVGDQLLRATMDSASVDFTVTRDSVNGFIFIKLVNPEAQAQTITINLEGLHSVKSKATVTKLIAPPEATNSLEHPNRVTPMVSTFHRVKPSFNYTLPANSIVVLKLWGW